MNQRIKVSFFGSSLVSAYWNGAATYYRGITRALDSLGYEITFFEPDAYDRQMHRDILRPSWAKVRVFEATRNGVLQALKEASEADIIIKASGVGAFDEFLEEAVLELRRTGVKAVFWDVDAPATLDRVNGNGNDPFLKLIPEYDLILTYGGGRPVIDAYNMLGAKGCVPIYNALDPDSHYPVGAEERYRCDLGFIGNRLPDRESRVWEFFFNAAAESPDRGFILGGNGWDGPGLPNVKYIGHVYTRDHNAFNCSAGAVLNVNRESMARYGFSPPTRIFEAAGAGACIITDEWEGIELFLEPGKEVLVARDGHGVAERLKRLTPEEAASIGRAAFERILGSHTYAHRAKALDRLFSTEFRPSVLTGC